MTGPRTTSLRTTTTRNLTVETVYGDDVHIVVAEEKGRHVLAGTRCSCGASALFVNGRAVVTHEYLGGKVVSIHG